MRIAAVLMGIVVAGAVGEGITLPIPAQTGAVAAPHFDVASINPAPPSDRPGRMGWADSARFVVQAESEKPVDRGQLLLSLRALLADRFRLVVHNETRQLDVYGLVRAKTALSLKTGSNTPASNVIGHNWDFAQLARYLTNLDSDRPVVDRTELAGRFDPDQGDSFFIFGSGWMAHREKVEHKFGATFR